MGSDSFLYESVYAHNFSERLLIQKMKVLIVTNAAPFPSRDGVTVVSSSYTREFIERGFKVDLLYLKKPGEAQLSVDDENHRVFRNVDSVGIRRQLSWLAFGKQVLGGMPYFSGWDLIGTLDSSIASEKYDVIWVTPRAAVALVGRLRDSGLLSGQALVGGVNDIASLRFFKMGANRGLGSGLKQLLKRFSYYLQAKLLWQSEHRMLKLCDAVHVQTEKELEWARANSDASVRERYICQPNGVDDVLFDLPLLRSKRSVVFVGALDGMYVERVRWFVQEVLPAIRLRFPDVEVHVVGRCADTSFVEWLESQGLQYQSFVDDVCELYAEHAVLVAPIFKGYGLINKVVQAMAAGTLVVGDVTAFNGINGFRSDVHGKTATAACDFSEQIVSALDSSDYCLDQRLAARALVSDSFRWNRCADTVLCGIGKYL